MPNYHRAIISGGTFFFTVVTFDRTSMLTTQLSRQVLRCLWRRVQTEHSFVVGAVCLLPVGDGDYSLRWSAIKRLFTREYLRSGGRAGAINDSRRKRGEAAVWQRRFWEHTIRDEDDFSNHFDYIHYNPVKHG